MRPITRHVVVLVAVVSLVAVAAVFAGGGPECRRRGAEMLRAEGPAGLERALANYSRVLADGPRPSDPHWREAADFIDAVAAQRDAWASKLYWYTDLDQAKAAAVREGKPILSLRLLGKLDTELSCANSRFFRTTLYPDPRVNSLLRDKFILHWSSERPVPVVTVDFGDGRKMTRTVTGNSIHYVLDAAGRPLDALPGLYSATEFVAKLTDALALAAEEPNDARLREWHQQAAEKLAAAAQTMSFAPGYGEKLAPEVLSVMRAKGAAAANAKPLPPAARLAAPRAISKGAIEMPMVDALTRLQMTIAQDTMQNEFTFHRQIHWWFAVGEQAVSTMDRLNERVYAELFLTPRSDPWLGLAPDAYPALDNDGLALK